MKIYLDQYLIYGCDIVTKKKKQIDNNKVIKNYRVELFSENTEFKIFT